VYQTRKRGTLETDLLLSTFGRDFLPTMSVEEMKQFDKVSLAA
jgi:succinate dehydrogenase assembly factor 2